MSTPKDSVPPAKASPAGKGTPAPKPGAKPAAKAGAKPAVAKKVAKPAPAAAPKALQIVPGTMATVYKVLPMTLRDNVLTVAMGDPSGLAALDDLRNFLGVKDVQAVIAPQRAIDEATAKAYTGKEESILDLI